VTNNLQGEEFWRLKIAAFLHDPPQKALLLGRGVGHEAVARELIEAATGAALNGRDWETAKLADRIAAASDRSGVQPEMETFWSKEPILIHPLSADKLDLGTLRTVDVYELNQRVARVISDGRARCHDMRAMFLWLWRCLGEKVKEADQGAPVEQHLGALWDHLPADTRIPEHTIWHHNRITSALATALPKPALLLMSLGPVQSFISCARKTRDLWAGSFILSYLAWQGMKAAAQQYGPDSILFPDLRHQPLVDHWLRNDESVPDVGPPARRAIQVPSLPNRWVIVLPGDDLEEAADKCRAAMRDGWTLLADTVLGSLSELAIDGELWRRQLEWLEVYWSGLRWPKADSGGAAALRVWATETCGADSNFDRLIAEFERNERWRPNLGACYGPSYGAVDRLHNARKLLRNFNSTAEPGYKCTLCGIREPIRPHGLDSRDLRQLRQWWAEAAPHFGDGLEPDGSERLCTVCTIKRLSPRAFGKWFGLNARFPSTSEIAATSFKASVLKAAPENQELRNALRAFCEVMPREIAQADPYVTDVTERNVRRLAETFPAAEDWWRRFGHLDGEWLFAERYQAEKRESEPRRQSRFSNAQIDTAVREHQKLIGCAQKNGIAPPSPYYAVLVFDGDRMGEWVSGTHPGLPQIREILHPQVIAQELGDGALGALTRPQSPALHGALSATLLGFALDVSRFAVERASGSEGVSVYSGGDDVLAFAPIAIALPVADMLRRYFCQPAIVAPDGKVYVGREAEQRRNLPGRVHLGMGQRATASAGIAIAHHLQPLSQVLEAARDAERRAKDELGRDAFVVTLIKRSGQRSSCGAKWQRLPVILEFVNLFSKGELSPRFVYQLAQEEKALGLLATKGLQSELRRLLARHLMVDKSPPQRRTEELSAQIVELGAGVDLEGTVQLLSLAQFITRHSSLEVHP
jgi:CRISPR-associated protein Cmr2